MTPNEFKKRFPEYKHLEGNELWNKMEDIMSLCENILHADPFQQKEWLDKKGNLVRIGEPELKTKGNPTTSFRFIIWDASEDKVL